MDDRLGAGNEVKGILPAGQNPHTQDEGERHRQPHAGHTCSII